MRQVSNLGGEGRGVGSKGVKALLTHELKMSMTRLLSCSLYLLYKQVKMLLFEKDDEFHFSINTMQPRYYSNNYNPFIFTP